MHPEAATAVHRANSVSSWEPTGYGFALWPYIQLGLLALGPGTLRRRRGQLISSRGSADTVFAAAHLEGFRDDWVRSNTDRRPSET